MYIKIGKYDTKYSICKFFMVHTQIFYYLYTSLKISIFFLLLKIYKFKRMRRQAIDLEKIFPKDLSDKELLSTVYKEPLKLNNKTTTTQFKNGQKI